MTPEQRANAQEGLMLANGLLGLVRRIGLDPQRSLVAMSMALAKLILQCSATREDVEIGLADAQRTLNEEAARLWVLRETRDEFDPRAH